jgi:hypothetical protein
VTAEYAPSGSPGTSRPITGRVARLHYGRFHDAFSTAFYEFMNTAGRGVSRQASGKVFSKRRSTWLMPSLRRVYVDVLNANNYGAPILPFSNPLIETSGATFLAPRTWIDPRTVQIGARLLF